MFAHKYFVQNTPQPYIQYDRLGNYTHYEFGQLNQQGIQLGTFLHNNPDIIKLRNWHTNPEDAHQYLQNIPAFESKGAALHQVIHSLIILATVYREYICQQITEDYDFYPSFFTDYDIITPISAAMNRQTLFEGLKEFLSRKRVYIHTAYLSGFYAEYLSTYADIPVISFNGNPY